MDLQHSLVEFDLGFAWCIHGNMNIAPNQAGFLRFPLPHWLPIFRCYSARVSLTLASLRIFPILESTLMCVPAGTASSVQACPAISVAGRFPYTGLDRFRLQTHQRLTQAIKMDIEFDWDPARARENEKKHGISFREGATAFADRLSYTIPDPDHSVGEQRFLLLGLTTNARLVVVSHVERGDRIRLISVRPASSRERMDYEQNQP